MSLIEWKNVYSVGVYEIDSQHKKLFDIINKLNHAMQQEQEKLVLGHTIKELFLYAQLLFWTEEKYFDLLKYAESLEHKADHKSFVTAIKNFKMGFDNGKEDLSESILDFLKEWWENHVLVEDMKYVDCFMEKGLS